MSFILHDVKRAELSNNSFESKNVTFLGVKTYSDPHTYFQGVRTPTTVIYAPGICNLWQTPVASRIIPFTRCAVNDVGCSQARHAVSRLIEHFVYAVATGHLPRNCTPAIIAEDSS